MASEVGLSSTTPRSASSAGRLVSTPTSSVAMSGVFTALADFVADQATLNNITSCDGRKSSEKAASLAGKPHTTLSKLLPVCSAPTSTATSLGKNAPEGSLSTVTSSAVTPVESAVMDLLASSTIKSDSELNRRLDELVASPTCDTTPTVNRSESADSLRDIGWRATSCRRGPLTVAITDIYSISVVVDPRSPSAGLTSGILEEGSHSEHYVPRASRLPGYPDPPPDEWGDWDEYRDDRDPGYRIRDIEESELMREIARKEHRGATTTADSHLLAADGGERAAEVITEMNDDDDELLMAHPAVRSGPANAPVSHHTGAAAASARGEALLGDLQPESRTYDKPPSPAFGARAAEIPQERPAKASDNSQLLPAQESRTSLKYDAYGKAHEVTVYKTEVSARHDIAMWRRNSLIHRSPRTSTSDDFYPVKWHKETSLEAIPTAGSKTMRTPPRPESCTYDVLPLNIVYERNRTGFEETKEFQVVTNMVIAARYRVTGFLGSAAFSKAVQAWDMRLKQHVCMKIIKNDKDFFDQSLDEIKLLSLLQLNAPEGDIDRARCLRMIDYFYHKEHLIIVTELLRDNLYEFSKLTRVRSPPQPQSPLPAFGSPIGGTPTALPEASPPVSHYFTIGRLQKITQQASVKPLEYIHSMGLMHCDLKPENILFQSYTDATVKVIDFGSSCFITDQLATYIQSRCYRAPEVILGLSYDTSIDIWSLGCIVAELWTSTVLFQNDSVQSLLARVVGIIGPFPEHMMQLGKLIPRYFTRDRQIYMEHQPVNPMTRSASWDSRHQRASPPPSPRLLQILVPKETSLYQRMRLQLAKLSSIHGSPSLGEMLRALHTFKDSITAGIQMVYNANDLISKSSH
ncbi:hypothetical protein FOL47_001388 [Perkinsus chesapeaki]|uniref:Protein kinase domain-containing protein n=1 Tax=Perkinsus chesapeaki TaxID=330153 RepID=A0A7J6MKX0_PERCH|nr:hypothetical protein FOL47_001388 [Perkinsus chesapeaki]